MGEDIRVLNFLDSLEVYFIFFDHHGNSWHLDPGIILWWFSGRIFLSEGQIDSDSVLCQKAHAQAHTQAHTVEVKNLILY